MDFFRIHKISDADPSAGLGAVMNGVRQTLHNEVYDLQGRKMAHSPLQRGIYIVNGRKWVK